MKNNILIVGAGEIGSALVGMLRKNKQNYVAVWDIDPKRSSSKKPLGEMASQAHFIFLCIPSHAIDACIAQIRTVSKKSIVISLTKGIERKQGYLTSELLVKAFGSKRIGILSGPMLAEEIKKGLPTQAILAGAPVVFKKTSALFANTTLSLYPLVDIHGASACGVLKNIYSMGLGIADGLNMGANTRGIFLLQSTTEMMELLPKLKGRADTVMTLSGLADLEATSSSEFSKNHTTGRMIARGKKITHFCEGELSLPLLVKRLGKKNLPPFMAAISAVAHRRKHPRKVFSTLLK